MFSFSDATSLAYAHSLRGDVAGTQVFVAPGQKAEQRTGR